MQWTLLINYMQLNNKRNFHSDLTHCASKSSERINKHVCFDLLGFFFLLLLLFLHHFSNGMNTSIICRSIEFNRTSFVILFDGSCPYSVLFIANQLPRIGVLCAEHHELNFELQWKFFPNRHWLDHIEEKKSAMLTKVSIHNRLLMMHSNNL